MKKQNLCKKNVSIEEDTSQYKSKLDLVSLLDGPLLL
jgi:hypothetical protein